MNSGCNSDSYISILCLPPSKHVNPLKKRAVPISVPHRISVQSTTGPCTTCFVVSLIGSILIQTMYKDAATWTVESTISRYVDQAQEL